MSPDRNPRRKAPLERVLPNGRIQQVAVDVQTTTPGAQSGNLKISGIEVGLTTHVRAEAIPNERADTVGRTLVEEWTSFFGPIESVLLDGSPSLVGDVAKNLTGLLGTGRMHAYAFRLQASETVQR